MNTAENNIANRRDVAAEISHRVTLALSVEQMQRVRAINKSGEEDEDGAALFLDVGAVQRDAFASVFGGDPDDSDADTEALMSQAWDMASEQEFRADRFNVG